jgi:hypothetical protein
MALKYLAGNRVIGTEAERLALVTGWLNVGTSYTQTANTSTYAGTTAAEKHCITYDIYSALGDSVASSTWVMRYEHTVTSTISATNGSVNVWTGISDADANTNHQANQDWIGVRLLLSANDSGNYGLIRPNTSNNSAPQSGQQANHWGYMGRGTENTKFYIEIKSTSSSGYSVSISNGNDYNGDVLSVQTDSHSATGLRYIKFGYSSGSVLEGAWDGLIENVQFRDGVTTWSGGTLVTPLNVYPQLSKGTLFEESDTGKHYMFDGTSAWNEMGP